MLPELWQVPVRDGGGADVKNILILNNRMKLNYFHTTVPARIVWNKINANIGIVFNFPIIPYDLRLVGYLVG